MMTARRLHASPALCGAVLLCAYVVLAMARGIDHDESQYVAAAVLSVGGLIPYSDYAYLQTPLQPFAFAPVAWAAGALAYPALRLVNALLGVIVVVATYRAMRAAGASPGPALACAALLACCDILLFSSGTARNDALPAALMALALPIMARPAEGTRGRAILAGLLLGCAAAAKVSFALPATAYGIYALFDRRHRPGWLLLGALPPTLLVAGMAATSPNGFLFGTFLFPATAPSEFYVASGRAWKLTTWAKLLDSLKFLALGPALLAGILVIAARLPMRERRRLTLFEWLAVAGLAAAVLPTPVWRQYFLPMCPALFVQLSLVWSAAPPGRWLRVAAVVTACAGLAPSIEALTRGERPVTMAWAVREGAALRAAADMAGVAGPVASLSPQFLPALGRPIDVRLAPGPFHFRSRDLVSAEEERRLNLVSRDSFAARFDAQPPAALLVGGEARWSAGDPSLDALIEGWALRRGWRRVPSPDARLRLYIPPVATAGFGRGGASTSVR